MPEGGFVIKFEGKNKKAEKCYAASFDYDEWAYAVNNKKKKQIPQGTKKIIIEVRGLAGVRVKPANRLTR